PWLILAFEYYSKPSFDQLNPGISHGRQNFNLVETFAESVATAATATTATEVATAAATGTTPPAGSTALRGASAVALLSLPHEQVFGHLGHDSFNQIADRVAH